MIRPQLTPAQRADFIHVYSGCIPHGRAIISIHGKEIHKPSVGLEASYFIQYLSMLGTDCCCCADPWVTRPNGMDMVGPRFLKACNLKGNFVSILAFARYGTHPKVYYHSGCESEIPCALRNGPVDLSLFSETGTRKTHREPPPMRRSTEISTSFAIRLDDNLDARRRLQFNPWVPFLASESEENEVKTAAA
ncbi:hypothetical protein RRG08_048591 [Elysia crispata]|uniref:Uncharacterized protein n=1 Tax=Elysia crispata TaxID=231223 RepID=A0AAE1ADB7_9GAST|nr:hypothetical protein RRG08_048591 [Elysia crispata]